MSHLLILIRWIVIGAIVSSSSAQAQTWHAQPLVSIEGVDAYQMHNGMRVLLHQDPGAANIAVVIAYNVGSRHEGRGERGMAHLLEHMLFKGTETFPDAPGVLKEHGALNNAQTWTDRTIYFQRLLATDENLDFSLRFEADRMQNASFDDDSLAKEMSVVANEFEMGESDGFGVVYRALFAAAYTWHPYGAAPIGNRSDIARVPADNLRSFYSQYYRPENATLVVSGRFEPDRALAIIDRYFGVLRNPDQPMVETWTDEPVQDGPRHVDILREAAAPTIGLFYHTAPAGHPDASAVAMLNPLLSDVPWGRLYKEIVLPGLAGSVSVLPTAMKERGQILVIASLIDGQDPDVVLERIEAVMEGFAENPVTEEEIARSRASLLAQRRGQRANELGFAYALADSQAIGDWRLWFIERERIKSMKPSDVQQAAARLFVPSNRTSVILRPTPSPIRADVSFPHDWRAEVEQFRGTEVVTTGEAFDPTPENVERRLFRQTLDQRARLVMLPKQTAHGAVRATIHVRFGDPASRAYAGAIPDLVGQMLPRGTQTQSFQEKSDELDQLESTLYATMENGFLRIDISTTRQHIPRLLDLAFDMIRRPTFPESEFEPVRTAMLSNAEARVDQPLTLV